MLTQKLYQCQIQECGKSTVSRSIIKSGEHKGKKVCNYCKIKINGVKPVKKFTQKNLDKRREERKDLTTFFKNAIEILKLNPKCQNCGCSINVNLFPVNNIAHILGKSHYKSVMVNPLNFVILCDSKENIDGSSCHYDFDNRIRERHLMPVFEIVMIKYKMFKDDVLEEGKEKEIFESYL